MALSLPGERSIAAASRPNPLRACLAFLAGAWTARARRKALRDLLDLDAERLRDLGISPSDIREALRAEKGRTAGMVLSAARARAARA